MVAKAFAVEFPLHPLGMTYSHYLLYHGREYPRWPHKRPALPMFGDSEKRPLCLVRNVQRMPAVFGPVGSLVVSSLVKQAIGPLPSVEYRRVRFARLTDFDPPPLGDSSFQTHPAYERAAATRSGLNAVFSFLPIASSETRAVGPLV